MDALRRLFGGGGSREAQDSERGGATDAATGEAAAAGPPNPEEIDADERARELELLRAEQERLDELVVRQQRYADRSWVPPSQGGTRRADDGERNSGEER
jgi:hypothetical protein